MPRNDDWNGNFVNIKAIEDTVSGVSIQCKDNYYTETLTDSSKFNTCIE